MRVKLLILLAVIAIGNETRQVSISKSESDYHRYRNIVNGLTDFTDKLRVLQAIWAEVLLKYPTDQYKAQVLYLDLSLVIKNYGSDCECELQNATKLQQEIAQHVIQQSSASAAAIFNGKKYPTGDDLYRIVLPFLEGPLKVSIYEAAIDKIYNFQEPQILAAYFEYMREQISLAPLEDLTCAQLYIYWKFMGRGQVNEIYLFNVAYYFLQLRTSSDYGSLTSDTKLALAKAISSLPSSLQYLYFEPKFCLLNKEYTEFIYTTNHIPIDTDNAHVFTWTEKMSVGQNGHWVKNITKLSDRGVPQLHLEFALKSDQLKNFMYRTTIGKYKNIVASLDDGSVPPNGAFTVEYEDNVLVIRQNGFIMCSKDELYGKNRRLVYTYQDVEHTASNPACQWIARECP